ncbi:Homocysteine S-methyltransferase [Obba rivulosa]|uniref:Homocysteine S-methyltransferase n=1 Tax=Obba rivulosa TaxID=1052685 RepID=A0A8E2DLL2_9APHY|nr:Homocysteine S-methyltransferase [Obba rivulosa]
MASTQITRGPGTNEVLILDGGLGTTLEDTFHQNISSPLWSAKPIDEEPEIIVSAHLAFLRAGADVILSATYQCAFETFARAGYSRRDATRLMRKAVQLAAEARRRYQEELAQAAAPSRAVRIALSLGPYGATLSPAQEFDGFYPPPFGPKAYTSSGENWNAILDTEEERASIDALTAFHLERLRVFAEDTEVWNTIDFVAFETVPLLREVKAVRRAVALLQNEMGAWLRPWWITTVYSDGQFPEQGQPGGDKISVQRVVEAALCDDLSLPAALPPGLGINCTNVTHLTTVLYAMTHAVQAICATGRLAPFLVLYPNRGDVFDPETQLWHHAGAEQKGEEWAARFWHAVTPILRRRVWHGAILGGCCKTGPDEIAALSNQKVQFAVVENAV